MSYKATTAVFEPRFPVPCAGCPVLITAANDHKLGREPGTFLHRACQEGAK